MEISDFERALLQQIRSLPATQQQEVLEFTATLARKFAPETNERSQRDLSAEEIFLSPQELRQMPIPERQRILSSQIQTLIMPRSDSSSTEPI